MEDKYYTPTVEEFHIGFEYEILKEGNDLLYQWEQDTIQEAWEFENIFDSIEHSPDVIRVKYLDRKDIESFGFSLELNNDVKYFKNERYIINMRDRFYDNVFSNLNIYDIQSIVFPQHLFCGKIKNKSEFKKLLIQLGIWK